MNEEELERIYQDAVDARASGAVPLGLAPFIPLVEEALGAAFSGLSPEQQTDAIFRFRSQLSPPSGQDLREAVSKCRLCPNLQRPVVVGEGRYYQPRIAFYGEAPGKEEHEQKRPFVGPAGRLFRSCLVDVGLKEEEIWISNSVRCFPPGKDGKSFGKPSADDVARCRRWMMAEIETQAPKLVVLLGSYSLGAVFPKLQISKARGEVRRVGMYQFLPVWHPSYVLRDLGHKPDFEADLSLAARLTQETQ